MALNKVLFETPPVLTGTEKERLEQLYRHLFDMSNKLNEALMTITIGEEAAEEQNLPAVRMAGAAVEQKTDNTYNSLKSMIVKNAEIARTAMEEIRVQLNQQYTAISQEFGTYQQTITNQVVATAEGIMQEYNVDERIQAVENDTDEFINSISAYIYSGILDPNDPSKVGIAIGYNVTNPDGTLNQQNKMATFTADRLSFWINENEAAYFSNSIFYIANGNVTDTMRMGSYVWKVMTGGAMGLMKG